MQKIKQFIKTVEDARKHFGTSVHIFKSTQTGYIFEGSLPERFDVRFWCVLSCDNGIVWTPLTEIEIGG